KYQTVDEDIVGYFCFSSAINSDVFYGSSGGRKPDQIIIFRDGTVSQFNKVLNVELNQIIEACEFLGKDPQEEFK
ncbi:hypothetical protein MKX03_006198, partial [Papaver bracteatum]